MSTSARSSQVSPPTRYDALGQGLAELKTTIESTMQNCDNQRSCGADSQDENEQRRKDTDAFCDAMRTDVAEIARMAAAERQKAASHARGKVHEQFGFCGDGVAWASFLLFFSLTSGIPSNRYAQSAKNDCRGKSSLGSFLDRRNLSKSSRRAADTTCGGAEDYSGKSKETMTVSLVA
ncbi:hypothetical protein BDN70DRAFT_461517 [Pholiota conissans]|uniref:Uncharacterized protein n=1 Tax=Pholiota conissans TaxID=109636 RepID=A0A9P6D7N1_9AGAR|nr:hypothetical protein BDN70DRAFT_461517 [Pholiota conissans]